MFSKPHFSWGLLSECPPLKPWPKSFTFVYLAFDPDIGTSLKSFNAFKNVNSWDPIKFYPLILTSRFDFSESALSRGHMGDAQWIVFIRSGFL